jgi:hypothetical protein
MTNRLSGFLGGWIGALAMFAPGLAHAVDSYRFMHVTIETPWAIFLFLLVIVLIPFILSAILHWHFAGKKSTNDDEKPPT